MLTQVVRGCDLLSFTCKHVGLAVLGGVTGDVGPADVANRKLPGVVDRDSLGPSFGIDDPYPFCVFNPVIELGEHATGYAHARRPQS